RTGRRRPVGSPATGSDARDGRGRGAMARDPNDRFDSAADMAAALTGAFDPDETLALRFADNAATVALNTPPQRGGTQALPIRRDRNSRFVPRPVRRPRRLGAAAVAFAVVIAAATAIGFGLLDNAGPAPSPTDVAPTVQP